VPAPCIWISRTEQQQPRGSLNQSTPSLLLGHSLLYLLLSLLSLDLWKSLLSPQWLSWLPSPHSS
jgi:hypothetical protein